MLTLIGRGLSNAETAQNLFMSEAAIKTYVSRMLTKLELANRTQAAILAHEAGLYDLSTAVRADESAGRSTPAPAGAATWGICPAG